ncbi:MAG: hypothetical protein WBE93_23335, partial [Pseudolabrys sp.]
TFRSEGRGERLRSVRLLSCAHRLPIGMARNRKVPPQRIQSCLGSSAREGSSVGGWCCAMEEGAFR